MNVTITGRKVKIIPQIRKYIEKKMKKLDHYVDHIYDFIFTVKRERHTYFAEVNINVKKKIIHIFAKSEDVYSVIDILFDKIENKLQRYRDKLLNRRVIPLKESQSQIPEQEVEETAS